MYEVQTVTGSQTWIPVDAVEAFRIASLHLVNPLREFARLNDQEIAVIETPEHRIRRRRTWHSAPDDAITQRPYTPTPEPDGDILFA